MKIIALAAVLVLGSACSAAIPPEGPALDMVAFFTGKTRGEGQLSVLLEAPKRISVDSVGRTDRKGDLILDQTVREEGKAARNRRWVMRRAGPGRFTGTLTDAVGPVSVTVAGSEADIRYKMKDGLSVAQTLQLQPGGQTIANRMAVKKFGVRVARLQETIRKLD